MREYNKKILKKETLEKEEEEKIVSPSYIKSTLKTQGFIDNQITPDIIEEKRNIIKSNKNLLNKLKTKQNYE